jgi:hypothetical protein
VACILDEFAGQPWRVVGEALRQLPCLASLFAEFWQRMMELCRSRTFANASCALEVSLNSTLKGRVHLHAFLALASKNRGVSGLSDNNAFTFRNRPASHIAACNPGRGVRTRARAVTEGHYYLQAAKIGSVLQWSTYRKNEHFAVQARWVLGLWRLHKLDHEGAKRELILARDRAGVHLQEIEKQQALEYDLWCTEQERVARQNTLLAPFKPPLPEEAAWLRQYALATVAGEALPPAIANAGQQPPLQRPKLRRYKTLVYDGPSRTGKSERAMHWFTETKTLKLNCQRVSEPNMRPFLSGQWQAVLFEECTWELLWTCRQLFQAAQCRTQLGQSQCNEHCYSVWCHGVPFMCCSNNFWEKCTDPVAREWVSANIVYVRWESPTWMESTEHSTASHRLPAAASAN